jgi:CRISPR-associated endonuclease/helicase Cas3
MTIFAQTFQKLAGTSPFPWQIALYQRFLASDFPSSCNLPTGLGKTSVMAVWLAALADNSQLPRRLVYVVNRRTVVDQSTREAEKLLQALNENHGLAEFRNRLVGRCALKKNNADAPLAISTLRGQFADNQDWSADPARPAIICGTVDMIGSRLLFNGYGRGFKSRPLHAGFLGQDSLIVHDEAHLEPAFQQLLEEIEKEQRSGRYPDARPLRVMALSATTRDESGNGTFGLTNEEREPPAVIPDPPTAPIHHVWRRLTAKKSLWLHEIDDDKKQLVDRLVQLAMAHRESDSAVLIFAREVDTVEKVSKALRDKLGKDAVATLTGTMRGLERNSFANKNSVFARFLPPRDRPPATEPRPGTAYLVCTSAGEVGVNISADHLVSDLTPFDSMAQRFGRVNRFGERTDARIDVIHPVAFPTEEEASKKPELDYGVRRGRTLALLIELNGDASPLSLGKLDSARKATAFTPTPVILPTSDILFDSWSLTTIREKLPGRPPVDEYLHGVAAWEPPVTQVAWREEVEVLDDKFFDYFDLKPEEILEDYPLKPHELLQEPSSRVFEKLKKLADRCADKSVWTIDRDNSISRTTLRSVASGEKADFAPSVVLLSPETGGLSLDGLFDPASDAAVADVADEWERDQGQGRHRRLRVWDTDPDIESKTQGMRLIRTIDINPDRDEHEAENGEVDENGETLESKRRFWRWFLRADSTEQDGPKTTIHAAVTWDDHTRAVEQATAKIASALLPDDMELQTALVLAARFHDLGKRRTVWQRSIGNPRPDEWYAKSGLDPVTGKRWRVLEITHYRHEFGSLIDLLTTNGDAAAAFSEFRELSPDSQDVVLHLIAAHHGRGRPHFLPDETFDPERAQRIADEIAIEIPRRFGRLQRRFGRWGLAWLESLLRAADIAASRKPLERHEVQT